MRVLMFGWEFPPHITGGLGTACYGLTRALSAQNQEIIFVVPKLFGDEDTNRFKLRGAGNVLFENRTKNIKQLWERFTYLEVGSNLIPYVGPEEFKRIMNESKLEQSLLSEEITKKSFEFSGKYGSDLLAEVSRYALVAGIIGGEENFDVIHAHDWLTYPAGIMAKQTSGKPLVIHVHATEFDRSGENVNQSVYDIERRGMEMADKIITVSNLTRKRVIERYGIPEEKVVTVYNAVEPAENAESDSQRYVKEKVVTFLGRVTFQKGPDYFIEAANKVLKKTKDVRFVMAGTGDMLNKMIKQVARLGISTHFHFTGFLKGDEVEQMFNLSDVYVMPSVSEPFGISPLEAMRSNVPVIISKQSGVAEILNHAIKVDFWDIDAMADAIYGLLNYNGLPKMFRKMGRAEVDNLKWENSAQKVIEVYKTLVN